MNKLMIKKGSTLFAALLGAAVATSAWAVNFDSTPVFSQDFEDAETYTSQMSGNSPASTIFGTKAGTEENPSGTVTQGERTIYGADTVSRFFRSSLGGSSGGKKAMFTIPTETVSSLTSAYKLEFDYFHPAATYNGNNTHSGLVISGTKGILATFYSDAPANSGTSSNGYIYNGDDKTAVLVSGFQYGPRYADPASADYAAYWYHVTIEADSVSGIRMSVTRANGTVTYMDKVKISDTYDVVTSLYMRSQANNSYDRYMGLDNVFLYGPSAAQTFEWTGAANDGKWSTPGNWSVDGIAQTDAYPGVLDTAKVALTDQTISVDYTTTLGILDFDATTKLSVDVSDFATEEEVALLSIANKGGTTFSTSNIEITGVSYSSYEIDDTDANSISVKIWSKMYYVWTDAGEDHLWNNTENWTYGDGKAVDAAPVSDSKVVFPETFTSGTEVELNANMDGTGQALVLNCDVAIKSDGTTIRAILPSTVTGDGTLTLSYIQVETPVNASITIENDIVIEGSCKAYVRGQGSEIYYNGDITGSGSLDVTFNGGKDNHFFATGSLANFGGTLKLSKNSYTRNATYLSGDDATINLANATIDFASAEATLSISGTFANNVLKAGAITGYAGTISNGTSADMTLEVGNDTTDATGAAILGGNGAWTVKKIGSNVQVLSDTTVAYNANLTAGTLSVPAGKTLGTVVFNGGKLGFIGSTLSLDGSSETLLADADFGDAEISADDFCFVGVSSADYRLTIDVSQAPVITGKAAALNYFIWTGAGDDNLFSTLNNWILKDGWVPTNVPYDTCTLEFPETLTDGAEIEFDGWKLANDKGFTVLVNCEVTMRGADDYNSGFARDDKYHFKPASIEGSGSLICDNLALQTVTFATLDVNVPIEVTNKLWIRNRGGKGCINWNTAITGDGTLQLTGDNGNLQKIYGDMSGFEGVLDVDYTLYVYGSSNTLDFSGLKLDIAKDVHVYLDSSCTATSLEIGSINGATGYLTNNRNEDVSLTVGARDDSTAMPILNAGGNGHGWTSLTKKGCGILTATTAGNEANTVTAITLDGGAVVLPSASTIEPTTTTAREITSSEDAEAGTKTYLLSGYSFQSHTTKRYFDTLAEVFAATDDGTEAFDMLVDTCEDDVTIGEGQTFWPIIASGQTYSGDITLAGGTLYVDSGNAGTFGGTLTAQADKVSTINSRAQTYTGLPTLTGEGTVRILLDDKRGVRFTENKTSGFTGKLVFVPVSNVRYSMGLMKNTAVDGNVDVEVAPEWSVSALTRAVYFEHSGTMTMKSLNIDDQYAVVYWKYGNATVALAGTDENYLNCTFAMQNAGYAKINQTGAGTLRLGPNFQFGKVTTLGVVTTDDSNYATYDASEQTYQVVVSAGTFTVDSGADLSNVSVTLSDGIRVTAGFTAKTIVATAANLVTPDGETVTITGTAGEGQTLTLSSGTTIEPGTASVEFDADDLTAAQAIADTYEITLTTAQSEAGIQTTYYQTVAKYNSETGKYYVTTVFADEVTPDFTGLAEGIEPMVLSSDKVTFNISNMKNGLYYGVFAFDAATTALPDGLKGIDLDQKTSTHTPTLSAAINSEDTVKFYRVVVSDANNK